MPKSDIRINIDNAKLQQLARTAPELVDTWLRGVAEQMRTEIVTSFNTSPPGRAYDRGSVTHVASQPGYPPNIDTGALRASIIAKRMGLFHYRIQDGVEYGVNLELGIGPAPRPFVRPVFDRWRRQIEKDAKKHGLIDG